MCWPAAEGAALFRPTVLITALIEYWVDEVDIYE